MKPLRLAAALGILLAAGPAICQTVDTITEAGLGYPVPEHVNSLTPGDFFRSHNSLMARFFDLAMQKDFIEAINLPQDSHRGRDIWTFKLTSPGDTTPEGTLKSSWMVQGTIHAREWASAEVVAGIYEWLAEDGDTGPVARYLIENTITIIHPVGNPDGFVMTQTHYNQTVNGGTSGNGRDGRMRRKNHLDTDEDISTFGDYLLGVDLNRNHSVGFGSGSSGTPTSIVYHGGSAGNQPESQALYSAAALTKIGGVDRIRLYIDYHSFSQLYFVVYNGSSVRNEEADKTYTLMRDASEAISGVSYFEDCVTLTGEQFCSGPIGATDEFFGGNFGCLSYTCEIRPSFSFGNGFILPENEIAETRAELLAAARSAAYFMAGPPVLTEVVIYEAPIQPSSQPLFHQRREFNASTGERQFNNLVANALTTGKEYEAVLRFNKPMRIRNAQSGTAALMPGQAGPIDPTVQLGTLTTASNPAWEFDMEGGNTGYDRYPGDTVRLSLDLSGVAGTTGTVTLTVDAIDATGRRLDTEPATVADWTPSSWINLEDSSGKSSNSGGTDSKTLIHVAPPDSSLENWLVF